ncbi:hypothetical protein D918_02368 [Trichuris suis]|nr:hypothetical protein D918_02368 [Trichuris suis]
MSQQKKQSCNQKDCKSRSSSGSDDKSRRSDTLSPKSEGKQGLMHTFRKKVSELRGSLRLGREQAVACKKDGQATEKQKKADIEKVITERMKNWGRVHNLPDWAQERIAKSVVQEDERRKRRAELEAKKFQILKKATLRHAIVIGDKAAAEEKVKAQVR